MNCFFLQFFHRWPEFALAAGRERRQHSRHAGFCTDNFHWSIPAFPGPAFDRQVHPAVVWRWNRNLDGLPVVFPGTPAGRLCLRTFQLPLAQAAAPSDGASGPARHGPGAPAHHARRCLETNRGRKSNVTNSRPAHRVPGTAVFRPLGHRSADATLV